MFADDRQHKGDHSCSFGCILTRPCRAFCKLEQDRLYMYTVLQERSAYRSNMSTTTTKLKVVLFLGSVRQNRLAERVGKFMQQMLEKTNHEVTVFDPMEMKFPLLEKAVFEYSDRSQAPQWMVEAESKIKAADAFLIVTAEYNHSIPPALSNMMDHFGANCYGYKPSGIVCYSPGVYGGMRSAMQLRAFLGELGCLSVSNIFGIPKAYEALDEDGNPLNHRMESRATHLLKELDWHANAMKNHREKFGTVITVLSIAEMFE